MAWILLVMPVCLWTLVLVTGSVFGFDWYVVVGLVLVLGLMVLSWEDLVRVTCP